MIFKPPYWHHDNIKFSDDDLKILKYESVNMFYFFYILLAFIVIFDWMILPKFLLLLFLIVASYHFGKEDSEFIKSNSKNDIIYFSVK